jgi:hypothetical protein
MNPFQPFNYPNQNDQLRKNQHQQPRTKFKDIQVGDVFKLEWSGGYTLFEKKSKSTAIVLESEIKSPVFEVGDIENFNPNSLI